MKDVYDRIKETGILPVIKLNDVEKAGRLGKALVAGGIPIAEVTFRAEGAAEAIRLMKEENPEMLVGAGTVLTAEQAEAAIESGAAFIVAPGFNQEVVGFVQKQGVPMIPGAMTPSEIEAVMKMGIRIIKFFPAEPAGGLTMIEALSAPYGGVTFIPTGGIDAGNLGTYLSSGKIHACGGSWMVKADLIDGNQFDKITELCQEAVQIKERVRK